MKENHVLSPISRQAVQRPRPTEMKGKFGILEKGLWDIVIHKFSKPSSDPSPKGSESIYQDECGLRKRKYTDL